MDEFDKVCESQEAIGQAFINYYHNLFTSEVQGCLEEYLFAMQSRITEDMNNRLLREFTMEEISEALNQM